MYKILIVEDEPDMRLGLKDNLEFEEYEVDVAENGRVGYEKIINNKYDLVLMDVMMPEMSGFEVCKQIRKDGINVPIILLTAKGEEIDKVRGLELGADDYITKPFSLRELLARVKAVLRRAPDSIGQNGLKSSKAQIGLLAIDFSTFVASSKNKPVQMSHKEFELLHYLWDKRNTVVTRDDLLNKIWGYEESPTTRTVDNFIVRLRQKIEKDPERPHIIITVHGIGYKLIEGK
ncbi:MAG: response regulator transcription factor [Ignavibacteriaceae bacterium]|jgi:DNA-binding response OmpR family regulator|nr:response regulator transcription factor [Ignavibacteriaceae bacterium]